MAKIAVELRRALEERERLGIPGTAEARMLAKGPGWRVADVLCTSGPQDRRFEERHSDVSIAMVLAGTFQYRASTNNSRTKNEVMTPGTLLLGGAGQCFDCGHEHGPGDRCVSFWYAPEYFEQIVRDAGIRHAKRTFPELRVPALKELSPLLTQVCVGLSGSLNALAWEEMSVKLAGLAARLVYGVGSAEQAPAMDQARVTRVIRAVEWKPEHPWTLAEMAEEAALSPHHFLRTFEAVAGVTPHQFILRTRLREAALRISCEPDKIVDIALGCGFGDVSNFNRAFRNEFGVTPRVWRSHTLMVDGDGTSAYA